MHSKKSIILFIYLQLFCCFLYFSCMYIYIFVDFIYLLVYTLALQYTFILILSTTISKIIFYLLYLMKSNVSTGYFCKLFGCGRYILHILNCTSNILIVFFFIYFNDYVLQVIIYILLFSFKSLPVIYLYCTCGIIYHKRKYHRTDTSFDR